MNDGSTITQISEQVDALKKKNIPIQYLAYPENKGKGYALRKGISLSQNKYVIYTDIDFPFTNESVVAVIDSLINDANDIVVGHRNYNYYKNNISTFRKILSKAFRFFIKNIVGIKITDTQCGLKGLSEKGKTKFLTTKINRYLFDFEFIFISSKDKTMRIKAVEVQLKENVVFSKMKLKILLQEFFNLFQILLRPKS